MQPSPPESILRFFRWFCRPDLVKYIEGDLLELFEENIKKRSAGRAKWLFFLEVIKLFRPDIIGFKSNAQLNNWTMFKNYLKVGMRSILKYKTFSFINIFGLAVAMSVAMLIILMIAEQHEMDQFHQDKDHIFRAVTQMTNSSKINASSPMPLATEAKTNYPIIKNATQLVRGVGGDILYTNGEQSKFAEVRGFFADQDFFEVFSFELVEGDRQSALARPNSILITSEVAYRLFNDRDPIGKTVTFLGRGLDHINIDLGTDTGQKSENWGSFVVTGVVDAGAYKTHLKFDALISASSLPRLYNEGRAPDHSGDWDNHSHSFTYFLLNEQTDKEDLQAALDEISEKEEELDGRNLVAQSIDDIVLGDFLGNPVSLRLPVQAYYILAVLALIVMTSAGLNYTNLSVARALTRAKEIGIRKVNGAKRADIFIQFMVESVLIACVSLLFANVILFLVRPLFLNLWVTKHLDLDLQVNISIFGIFLGFAIVVGLVAGLYPSTVLSRFSPTRIIKGALPNGSNRLGLKAVLNVIQFVFSLLFIVTAISIVRQFNHYVKHDYGMNTENLVNIPIQGNDYKLLMTALNEVPGVAGVSACHMIPAMPNSYGTVYSINGTENENWFKAELMSAHPHLFDNLNLEIIAGKNHDSKSEGRNQLVVNSFATKLMGFESPHDAINQMIHVHSEPWEIIGVVEDFKFQSLIMGEGDKSLLVRFDPTLFNYLNVKILSDDPLKTVAALEKKWEEVDPIHPMQAYFYDHLLAKSNQWMGDLAAVIGFIAFLAIVISCLGLLGMAVYSSERRLKEVGIRKVLGAGAFRLIVLLGRSFLILLGVSIFIAAPLSYFANRFWIDNIPNQIDFGWSTVLFGSFILLALGVLTIGSQIISVSRRNPVDSLKYD